MTEKYDFTDLYRKVSIRQALAQKKYASNMSDVLVMAGLVGVVAVVGFLIMGVSWFIGSYATVMLGLLIVVLAAVKTAAYWSVVRRILWQVRFDRFIAKNRLKSLCVDSHVQQPGLLFQQGNERTIDSGVAFEHGKYAIEMANYTVASGSLRGTVRHHYVRITLPRKLPHIVLGSKKNDILGRLRSLPVLMNSAQELHLESNFNEYFTVYVPKLYERDALYILTPDTMQLLADVAGSYDIEIVENYLYIYAYRPMHIMKEGTMEGLLRTADRLVNAFNRQVHYSADTLR